MSTMLRRQFIQGMVGAFGIACPFIAAAQNSEQRGKKLISFADVPNQRIIVANLEKFEQTFFDGVVFNLDILRKSDISGELRFLAFADKQLDWLAFERVIDESARLLTTKLTESFILLNVRPGNIDWFSKHPEVIARNFALIGRFCKLMKIRGVFFDPEEYAGAVWNISRLPTAGVNSPAEHRKRVEQSGFEIFSSFLNEHPAGVIFLPHPNVGFMGDLSMELYSYFINGIVGAIRSKIGNRAVLLTERQLIVSTENTYHAKERIDFEYYRGTMLNFKHVDLNPDFWKLSQISMSCSPQGGAEPFDRINFSNNFADPATFEKIVDEALRFSDKYCWIYTRHILWWRDAPSQYLSALKHVRALNEM